MSKTDFFEQALNALYPILFDKDLTGEELIELQSKLGVNLIMNSMMRLKPEMQDVFINDIIYTLCVHYRDFKVEEYEKNNNIELKNVH